MTKGNAAGTCAELNQPHFNIAMIRRATAMAPMNKKKRPGMKPGDQVNAGVG